jgi:hypothetical protein
MSASAADFETLLRQALSPVEPPAAMVERLEQTLVSLTTLAQEELDAWELSTMRDPRNWARPAAAAVVGMSAGTALVVLRVRRQHRSRRKQSSNVFDLIGHTVRDAADEAGRLLRGR